MKIHKLMENVKTALSALDDEMESMGFEWVVSGYAIDKAFDDIEKELRDRYPTSHCTGHKRR